VSASDILIDIHLARLCLTGDVLVEHLPDDCIAVLKKDDMMNRKDAPNAEDDS